MRNPENQVASAQQIQELLLEEFERQLRRDKKTGKPPASSTTIATITKWLERGGWVVLNPRVKMFPGEEIDPKSILSSTPSLGIPEPI